MDAYRPITIAHAPKFNEAKTIATTANVTVTAGSTMTRLLNWKARCINASGTIENRAKEHHSRRGCRNQPDVFAVKQSAYQGGRGQSEKRKEQAR